MSEKIRKVCAKCGSDKVKIDAFAFWNTETQEWDSPVVFPTYFCDVCDGETTIKDVPLDRLRDWLEAMSVEGLDEMVHNQKGHEASVINNAGKEAQIEYLLGEE